MLKPGVGNQELVLGTEIQEETQRVQFLCHKCAAPIKSHHATSHGFGHLKSPKIMKGPFLAT